MAKESPKPSQYGIFSSLLHKTINNSSNLVWKGVHYLRITLYIFGIMDTGFLHHITLCSVLWERDHLVVLVKVIMSEMRADLSLPINFYDHYARIAETSSLIDRKWLSLRWILTVEVRGRSLAVRSAVWMARACADWVSEWAVVMPLGSQTQCYIYVLLSTYYASTYSDDNQSSE